MNTRLAILLSAGTLALLSHTVSARADVLEVSFSPTGSVAAGSTDNGFDVLLTNTAGPDVSIGAFTFEVEVSSTDVVFTDATTATVAAPYIFSGNSLIGPDIVGSNTGQQLTAFDVFSGVGNVTLTAGETVGLGDVLFDVAPTASTETADLSFVPAGTSLSTADGVAVPIDTLASGQLSVTGAVSAVPEPSALPLLVTALALIGVGVRRQRLIRRNS